jgi:hypothetical protein
MKARRRPKDNFEPVVGFLTAITPLEKVKLSKEVSKIVGLDLKVCARFVDEIDEAAGLYRIQKEQVERQISGTEWLLPLAKVAGLAANALDSLDRTSASILAQKVWALAGKSGPTPSPMDIKADAARMQNIKLAAEAMAQSVRQRPRGNALSPELSSLISNVATAYASNFVVRPSYAEGPFSKVVRAIFQLLGTGRPPEKSALKRVFTGLRFSDLPPLRPGRKATRK